MASLGKGLGLGLALGLHLSLTFTSFHYYSERQPYEPLLASDYAGGKCHVHYCTSTALLLYYTVVLMAPNVERVAQKRCHATRMVV